MKQSTNEVEKHKSNIKIR